MDYVDVAIRVWLVVELNGTPFTMAEIPAAPATVRDSAGLVIGEWRIRLEAVKP